MRASRVVVVAALIGAATACGGGKTGPPTSVNLPGAGPIPVSQLTAAASQMCSIVAQSHADPGGVLGPFYAGPHNALHLLAAVANAKHPAQASQLLDVMLTYESAIATKPPPAATGSDADALLQSVDATLTALGVSPPAC